jgi:RimJ/RimL family protein N-acetyltransferase
MHPSSEQAHLIANLKVAPPLDQLIPVHPADAGVAGFLAPVTEQMAFDPSLIEALFRWRREHMTAFLTVFVPTLEKTRGYLLDFSLPDPARLLFLIKDRHHRAVGHIGLCNIAPSGAEVDNVIRGEPVDVPNFMVLVHKALLDWAFSALDVPMTYLNVLDHNTRAIRTYQKVGFKVISRTPLIREDFKDGYKLVPTKRHAGLARPMLLRMELQRDSFYQQNR